MIYTLKSDRFEFLCPECGDLSETLFSSLVAGVSIVTVDPDTAVPLSAVPKVDIINAGRCPHCGTYRMLNRYMPSVSAEFQRDSAGRFEQLKAVNAIHKALVDDDCKHADCATILDAEVTTAEHITTRPEIGVSVPVREVLSDWAPQRAEEDWSPNKLVIA